MIHWLHQEEGFCEGSFKSDFFRDDENGFAVENNKVVYVGTDYLSYMKDGE